MALELGPGAVLKGAERRPRPRMPLQGFELMLNEPYHVVVAGYAEMRTSWTHEELVTAARKVQIRHPKFRCRLLLHEGAPCFEFHDPYDDFKTDAKIVRERGGISDYLGRELDLKFNFEKECGFRVRWVILDDEEGGGLEDGGAGAADASEVGLEGGGLEARGFLVVSLDHRVGDGSSLGRAMLEMVDFLENPEKEVKILEIKDMYACPALRPRCLETCCVVPIARSCVLPGELQSGVDSDVWPIEGEIETWRKMPPTCYLSRQGGDVKPVVVEARRRGLTVGALVFAALQFAISKQLTPPDARRVKCEACSVSVDMRRVLTDTLDDEDVGYFSSTVTVEILPRLDETVWNFAERARQVIARGLAFGMEKLILRLLAGHGIAEARDRIVQDMRLRGNMVSAHPMLSLMGRLPDHPSVGRVMGGASSIPGLSQSMIAFHGSINNKFIYGCTVADPVVSKATGQAILNNWIRLAESPDLWNKPLRALFREM